MAPLLAGFPLGTVPTANPLLALATLNTEAEQREDTVLVPARSPLQQQPVAPTRACSIATASVDTPDRTVTPRRVLATQNPMNFVANHQSIVGTSVINELKIGYNRPQYERQRVRAGGLRPDPGLALRHRHLAVDRRPRHDRHRAQRPAGARHEQRLDQRTGLRSAVDFAERRADHRPAARTRSRSAASTANIDSKFQFLGSTEITYNSINDFIDNTPAQVAVTLDSPVFTPQQFYAIGFAQDTWRVNSRLTLELGLRYDFYSVVKEKDNLAKPFFIEDNAFAANDAQFYNPDKNNFAPRLSAVYQLTTKTALRAGFGHFYGPGQFEDRIQPIENYIERRRVQSSDVAGNWLAYPVDPAHLSQPAVGARLHARSSRRIQHPVRR